MPDKLRSNTNRKPLSKVQPQLLTVPANSSISSLEFSPRTRNEPEMSKHQEKVVAVTELTQPRPFGDNDLTLSLLVSSINRRCLARAKASTMVNCKSACSQFAEAASVLGRGELWRASQSSGKLAPVGAAAAATNMSLNNNAKRRPTSPDQKRARRARVSSLFFGSSLIFQLMLCYIVTRSSWPLARSSVEGMSRLFTSRSCKLSPRDS